MTSLQIAAVIAAGLAAGVVNTIVGSGSLITFPTLLAVGLPPVLANVSNTVGLFPGSISGAVGYRRELSATRSRLLFLVPAGALGAITGAVLLLALPPRAFEAVVPWLILLACALMAVQPWLSAKLGLAATATAGGRGGLIVTVFLSSVYGGYFGAAQGVILIALLAIFVADDMQRLNALKNVLQAVVNMIAAVVFIIVSRIDWEAALLLAAGSVIGGQIGAVVARRLPGKGLRYVVIVVGVIVAVELLLD